MPDLLVFNKVRTCLYFAQSVQLPETEATILIMTVISFNKLHNTFFINDFSIVLIEGIILLDNL